MTLSPTGQRPGMKGLTILEMLVATVLVYLIILLAMTSIESTGLVVGDMLTDVNTRAETRTALSNVKSLLQDASTHAPAWDLADGATSTTVTFQALTDYLVTGPVWGDAHRFHLQSAGDGTKTLFLDVDGSTSPYITGLEDASFTRDGRTITIMLVFPGEPEEAEEGEPPPPPPPVVATAKILLRE